MVTVPPGKWLRPDPQVGVGQERGPAVLLDMVVMLRFILEAVVSGCEASGYGNEERNCSPRIG